MIHQELPEMDPNKKQEKIEDLEGLVPKKTIKPPEPTVVNGLAKQVNLIVKPGEDLDEILNYIPNSISLLQRVRMFPETDDERNFGMHSAEEEKLGRVFTLTISEDSDSQELIEFLQDSGKVEFAEKDHLYELNYKPNDPYLEQLYGLEKMQCQDAWDLSQGEGVTVAVVDTGVDYNHPDIQDNMWRDENGKHGYNFSEGNDNPMDTQGHGSHVAGTIAAVGNNSKGIIGVAPKAKIMALKIFPRAYGSVISKALKYAVDNGAQVINNSWGPSSPRPVDRVLELVCDYVHAKGVVNVFAAGNNSDDVAEYSPANYSKTIAVASTDMEDKRSSFSNYGRLTDLAAPGSKILSLRHNSTGYRVLSGTSMASPHVAGLAALILSKDPSLAVEEVREIMKNGADKIKTDKPIGKGRANALASLNLLSDCSADASQNLLREISENNFNTDFLETIKEDKNLESKTEREALEKTPTLQRGVRDGSLFIGNYGKHRLEFIVQGRTNGYAVAKRYVLLPKQSVWSSGWDSGNRDILIVKSNYQNKQVTFFPFRGLASWVWYTNC